MSLFHKRTTDDLCVRRDLDVGSAAGGNLVVAGLLTASHNGTISSLDVQTKGIGQIKMFNDTHDGFIQLDGNGALDLQGGTSATLRSEAGAITVDAVGGDLKLNSDSKIQVEQDVDVNGKVIRNMTMDASPDILDVVNVKYLNDFVIGTVPGEAVKLATVGPLGDNLFVNVGVDGTGDILRGKGTAGFGSSLSLNFAGTYPTLVVGDRILVKNEGAVVANKWDSTVAYPISTVVQHQGRNWTATGTTTAGKQPLPSNTEWTMGADLLVGNGDPHEHNGVYRITDIGGTTTPWELTREVDFDSNDDMTPRPRFFVQEGLESGTTWVHVSEVFAVDAQWGVDDINFGQFGAVATDSTEGPGIDITANKVSVDLVAAESGMKFDVAGDGGKLLIDQSDAFNPTWDGDHTFNGTFTVESGDNDTSVDIKDSTSTREARVTVSAIGTGGESAVIINNATGSGTLPSQVSTSVNTTGTGLASNLVQATSAGGGETRVHIHSITDNADNEIVLENKTTTDDIVNSTLQLNPADAYLSLGDVGSATTSTEMKLSLTDISLRNKDQVTMYAPLVRNPGKLEYHRRYDLGINAFGVLNISVPSDSASILQVRLAVHSAGKFRTWVLEYGLQANAAVVTSMGGVDELKFDTSPGGTWSTFDLNLATANTAILTVGSTTDATCWSVDASIVSAYEGDGTSTAHVASAPPADPLII